MSKVKRYKLDVDGQHVAANRRILLEDAVAASDYDALAAQNAELVEALRELLAARGTSMDIVGHHPVTGHSLSREGMAAVRASAVLSRTAPNTDTTKEHA